MMRKQTLNIKDSWGYAMRCRHCGWQEVYVVGKTHMNYRTFYRQVTEQLVRVGFCQGCEEKGVHDLVAICQENYDELGVRKRNGRDATSEVAPPSSPELAQDGAPHSQPHEFPVSEDSRLVSGK
jgi:hypothetical protein